MAYFTYLLRCEGGELYAGITDDLERRFSEHASGGPRAAKYTRTHRPVRMEASWTMPDRASASALEYRLKRLGHSGKESLAADPSAALPLVAQSVARAREPRVLMLGNSLTTAHNLPGMLAEAVGGEVAVRARGGARLSEHLNPATRLGAMTQEALATGGWTHVVLQERSDGPVRNRAAYLRASAALCGQVRAAGAVPVVYATWAYAPGCPKLGKLGMSHAGMHDALQSAFAEAAAQGEAVLANAGEAFLSAPGPSEIYSPDGVHPSAAGADLAASRLASAIGLRRGAGDLQ